jgi:hypothetical protein
MLEFTVLLFFAILEQPKTFEIGAAYNLWVFVEILECYLAAS